MGTLLHFYRADPLNYSYYGPHHLVSQAVNDGVDYWDQDSAGDSKDLNLSGVWKDLGHK